MRIGEVRFSDGQAWVSALPLSGSMVAVDFLRRRISLHRNAVRAGAQSILGTLKSNKNRTVALPGFVIEALSVTGEGKRRQDLL